MQPKKAIIIGSGIAGLAASVRLAVEGYQVSVYEKNAAPGGKLSVFEKDGYRFDTGPSLFTQPENIEEIFNLAGEPIEEYFTYSPVDIACKYFFENGKTVDAYADKKLLEAEFENKLGEKPSTVKSYLENAEKLYNRVGTVFLNHSLHKRNTWLHPRILKALMAIKLPYIFSTLAGYNKKKFSSPEAVQIFNRFATYNGSNPYKAPGMLSLIPHLEQNQGTFYPAGGMISIAEALHKLALKKGVQFYFNEPVQRIILHEGAVQGVVVNNKNISAPIVISNIDVYFTYKNLLNHLPRANKIIKKERSSSALIFYWGIKKEFADLGLHNILFSNNYNKEFSCLFNKKTLFNDPTVYINITSKMETAHAPPGTENWFVMINAPANNGQDWGQLKKQARKFIIEKINRVLKTDIELLIGPEEILDPVLMEERTGSYMGSLYGTSSNSKLAAFFRPANFTSYARGLYFCGGSVHPGGGIPLCLKSAGITAGLITKDFRKATH